MKQKTLFISGAALIVVAFIMAITIYNNQQAAKPGASESLDKTLVERQGAAIKGSADAKVTIVEFLDPACGTCRDFYPLLRELLDQYPGQVKLMVRYAPLHTGSDQVVRMLEGAHRQGMFWPALELLFNNQQRWVINHVSQPQKALEVLFDLDLDRKQFQADVNDPALVQVIQQDMRDGRELDVQATPEFFVNGRSLPSFGHEQLSKLVKDTVEDVY